MGSPRLVIEIMNLEYYQLDKLKKNGENEILKAIQRC